MDHLQTNSPFVILERHQLEANIDKLTIDKANLLSRLQLSEENLKTANECKNCYLFVVHYLWFYSIKNERESHFRYDGNSTQEGH